MSPMDIEEAARHTAEHNERQRQQQAQERERTRRSRAGDSAGRAGNELIRSLSISTGEETELDTCSFKLSLSGGQLLLQDVSLK